MLVRDVSFFYLSLYLRNECARVMSGFVGLKSSTLTVRLSFGIVSDFCACTEKQRGSYTMTGVRHGVLSAG